MGLEPLWKHSSGNHLTYNCRISFAAKIEDIVPEDCCEFVGGLVDGFCEGRYCVDGSFCPSRVFADPKFFVSCPNRFEKLKSKVSRKILRMNTHMAKSLVSML